MVRHKEAWRAAVHGVNSNIYMPRPAQTRVAPAQGGNGVSPLRKIRDRDKRWG